MRTRLSTKGQIVLPKTLRDEMGWTPGAPLDVRKVGDTVVIRQDLGIPATTIGQVAGMLKYDGPPVSVEDMEQAVEEELAARWERKKG